MSIHARNKIITQDDVARQAGVTRSIVSYVINNGPRKVSAETRHRVLVAIKELGYRPNKHAQILSTTDGTIAEKYIGIILSGNYMFRRPHYGSMLASIHEQAHQNGWHIRFIRLFNDFCNPELFDELIHPNEIGGMILLGLDQVLRDTPAYGSLVEEIVRRVERVVCIEWQWPGVPSIQFDKANAAFQATDHLLSCGRRHIAYIGPDDRRMVGYQQTLREKGILPGDQKLFIGDNPISGYEACDELIRSGWPIDGLCIGADEVAFGVLNCLYQRGLRVPDDIAIASIDNLEMSAFTVPPLTTVDVPKHEMGLHAIDILVSDQTWKGRTPAFTITVPTQLIVRETSVFRTDTAFAIHAR